VWLVQLQGSNQGFRCALLTPSNLALLSTASKHDRKMGSKHRSQGPPGHCSPITPQHRRFAMMPECEPLQKAAKSDHFTAN
jgi:hypothetical protein